MELEKVLRIISDNKDIRPDEFDKILAPALKEEVITVRDILAQRGSVVVGLVTQDPIMISDGCFGWSVKFKFTIGDGTLPVYPVYTVMVSVYVIAGGEMSHQPNLVVSLTKEDGTCLYSGDWTYPKDGMPCMKCVILEAIGKAGIAWYDMKPDNTTTLKEALAMIISSKDIDSHTIDLAVMKALHQTVVETKKKCEKCAFGDRVLSLGKVQTSPRKWDKDNTTAQWKSVFTAGHCDIAVMVTVCDCGVYAYNPNISVRVSETGSPDEPCNPTRYICNPTMYLDDVFFHEFSGSETLYDMMMRALAQHIDHDGHIVDTSNPAADKKEWFFLEFWKHDNTLRAVHHDVDLPALKELWIEENKHYICTPIMAGLWPNMENSNEHS